MLFSFNHAQANQYLLSTNFGKLVARNMYLAIILESFLFLSSVNLINGVLYAFPRIVLKITKQGTFVDNMLLIYNGVCTKRTHSFSGIIAVSAQTSIYGQHIKSY